MKKKTVKNNKELGLKKEIEDLKDSLAQARANASSYRNILDVLKGFFNLPRTSYNYSNSVTVSSAEDLPRAVMSLIAFREKVEGAILPEREFNDKLLEIIRWHINPQTADQSKVIDGLLKDRGMNR